MKLIWLVCLAYVPSAVHGSRSMIKQSEYHKKHSVYTGPAKLSDVERRKQTIYNDLEARATDAGTLIAGGLTHTWSGLSGAANSLSKAAGAAARGNPIMLTAHTVAAPLQLGVGVAVGAASLAAVPVQVVAGAGQAAYQGAMMGYDKGKKLISRETEDQRDERRAGNVVKLVDHARSNVKVNKFHTGASKITDNAIQLRRGNESDFKISQDYGDIYNPHEHAQRESKPSRSSLTSSSHRSESSRNERSEGRHSGRSDDPKVPQLTKYPGKLSKAPSSRH